MDSTEQRTERRSGREDESEPARALREPQRVVDVAMARPQKQPGVRHCCKRPTRALETLRHPHPASRQPVANPCNMLAVLSSGEHLMDEPLGHLEAYLPLFRQLAAFRFLYLARFDAHFETARELFNALVTIPLGSDASSELLHYFKIRKAWELCRYASLTEADLIFRNQAQKRFSGQRFEHFYRSWKAGRIGDADVRKEFAGGSRPVSASFTAEVLSPEAAPKQDASKEG